MAAVSSQPFSLVAFRQGQIITLENDPAEKFYIVQEGHIRISRDGTPAAEGDHGVLSSGDVFGCVASLSNHLHIDRAEALGDVKLISIQRERFGALIKSHPAVALRILRNFSKRMRLLDHGLAALTSHVMGSTESDEQLFQAGLCFDKNRNPANAAYCYRAYLRHYPSGSRVDLINQRLPVLDASYPPPPPFSSQNQQFDKGQIVFAEGEPGDTLYIIQYGTVKITKTNKEQEMILAVLKRGDIFGEMAILDEKPRSASAVANEDCQLMAVNASSFMTLAAEQPNVVSRITGTLAERIWFMDKQLANAMIQDPLERIYDAIIMQLEKEHVADIDGSTYIFDFDFDQLCSMIGISPLLSRTLESKVMSGGKMTCIDGKLILRDIHEPRRRRDNLRAIHRSHAKKAATLSV
jgi:CRP-like cAMP-binding protein